MTWNPCDGPSIPVGNTQGQDKPIELSRKIIFCSSSISHPHILCAPGRVRPPTCQCDNPRLCFGIRPRHTRTGVGTKTIDGSALLTYGIAIAGFLLQDKLGRVRFFDSFRYILQCGYTVCRDYACLKELLDCSGFTHHLERVELRGVVDFLSKNTDFANVSALELRLSFPNNQ